MHGTHEISQPTESRFPLVVSSMRRTAARVASSYNLDGPIIIVGKERPESSRYIVAIGNASPTISINSAGEISKSVFLEMENDVFETNYGMTGTQVIDMLEGLSAKSEAAIICDEHTTKEVFNPNRSMEPMGDKNRAMGRQGRNYFDFGPLKES